ncbi:MAG: Gx transporter family protein [Candidatus Glassbacteria bacterium]|nr:Gx transporter family protein [Candidatus Glassbacteria bacterium]
MDVSQSPREIRRRTEMLALVALATVFELVLFVLDSAIPKPVPWIKLGLANIVTLALLVCVSWRVALAVHLMRIVVGSIFRGGLFSPFFLLSFSGGVVSFLVMAQAARWAMPVLGFIGVSVLGALAHNFTQLGLICLALADRELIGLLWPLVILFSLVYGCFVGFSSYHLCRRVPVLASGRLVSSGRETDRPPGSAAGSRP